MTEEIIINGVNVAGCINFVGCNMCNDFLDGQCEGHNCEYKQLKRLEQENKVYEQSEQEAIKIIADLKHQLSLFKQGHKTEQDRRRKFENALEEIRDKAGEIITNENKSNYWDLYKILSDILEKTLGVLNDTKTN